MWITKRKDNSAIEKALNDKKYSIFSFLLEYRIKNNTELIIKELAAIDTKISKNGKEFFELNEGNEKINLFRDKIRSFRNFKKVYYYWLIITKRLMGI